MPPAPELEGVRRARQAIYVRLTALPSPPALAAIHLTAANVFILSDQRDSDLDAFAQYRAYLTENQARFPRSAYVLATSGWYFDPSDPRCPHDAWLEELSVSEPTRGERQEIRTVSLRIRLLGAYHDGYIELLYPRVFSYTFALGLGSHGHRDWRYDELRVSEAGTLLHEIEWWGRSETARWCIEADDVLFSWHPREPNPERA